jgi:EpsI family protein
MRFLLDKRVQLISLLLIVQSALLLLADIKEVPPETPPLEQIPRTLGTWTVEQEFDLAQDVYEYLRPDSVVNRLYVSDGRQATLFIGYFKSLKSNYGPHSPRYCLPGTGWLARMTDKISIPIPASDDSLTVNRYIMERGENKIVVLYWYQSHARTWTDEITAKMLMLPDIVRYKRSDVALVRVVSPVEGVVSPDQAAAPAVNLIQELYPTLRTLLSQ